MKRIIVSCAVIVAFMCILFAHSQAYAGPDKPPTKESLLAAWEEVQKASPGTVKFEKTDEKNVYNFETTIFPYKGKLRVLNLLIDKHPGEYFDYDDDGASDNYVGIIEVSLDSLDKDFREKFYRSYETWARDNTLHYEELTAKWYAPVDWMARKREIRTAASETKSCYPAASEWSQTLIKLLTAWGPAIFFVGVWLWICVFSARKLRKKQDEVQAKYMQMAEENLGIQKQILEALKLKS